MRSRGVGASGGRGVSKRSDGRDDSRGSAHSSRDPRTGEGSPTLPDSPTPRLPDSADAVVVGAGAFGVSAAFHLARAGVKRVVLLDRYAPGSQTSPRAAGL